MEMFIIINIIEKIYYCQLTKWFPAIVCGRGITNIRKEQCQIGVVFG